MFGGALHSNGRDIHKVGSAGRPYMAMELFHASHYKDTRPIINMEVHTWAHMEHSSLEKPLYLCVVPYSLWQMPLINEQTRSVKSLTPDQDVEPRLPGLF